MAENHGDEPITDLTNSLEPQSLAASDQGLTSELSKSEESADDDVPQASGQAFIGELLYGRYRIISLIAKGGMGEVYKAKNETTGKFVAIKVLSERLIGKKENIYRFMREVSSVAVLRHPNLIAVSDIGLLANGCPYYVMEFIEGKSLADILAQEKTLDVDRVRNIFIQLAGALAAAHERGFIHRDIKPSNILVRTDTDNKDEIKLVDFGIAKRGIDEDEVQRLTAQGTVFGSPLYMSPEQCEGKPTDARSDVYSACCSMYECLTGHPPFYGETPLQTMSMHRSDRPQPLNLSDEVGSKLESVILKGMEKLPGNRFADANEMLAELGAQPVSINVAEQSEQQVTETVEEDHAKMPDWLKQTVIFIVVTGTSVMFFLYVLRTVFAPH